METGWVLNLEAGVEWLHDFVLFFRFDPPKDYTLLRITRGDRTISPEVQQKYTSSLSNLSWRPGLLDLEHGRHNIYPTK